MRLVFFLLLLANVLLFAWTRVGSELAMSESFLLSQQINSDAIRLLDPREVGQLAAKKPELKGLACLEWGALSPADLERAKTVLAVFSEGAKISERRMEESAAYWVYMPPRATRQDAQVKAALASTNSSSCRTRASSGLRFRSACSAPPMRHAPISIPCATRAFELRWWGRGIAR